MNQISSLPEVEKNKIFNMLLYQKSNLSEKDIETIEFMTASSERLKKWMLESNELIKETDLFIDEIKEIRGNFKKLSHYSDYI